MRIPPPRSKRRDSSTGLPAGTGPRTGGLRTSKVVKAVVIALVLFVLWVTLSGLFKPILVMLGLASTALVVAIVGRLGILDSEGVPLTVRFGRMAAYFGWLLVEVLKADWAVTRIILSPQPLLAQQLLRVPVTTRTDLAKVVYANSITLTPGTVTVETAGEHFYVHALAHEFADMDALAAMNDRVCATEIRDPARVGTAGYGPASGMA